ncbi:membrane protein [Thiomicrorhabdus immobilis]|uniref:Membrane protein n=1 Tax=Thiomicrorhabdus immobilis TaxID=2791037 RepID=A0ABN6CZK6_9GAMM|nr:MMPL family transporter [Thiomicrorhabdus immobilis]BCN93094.1 membrane protein [Thiomicrorhabdus immobilis]
MLAINPETSQQKLNELSQAVKSQLLILPGVKQVLNGSETFQSPLQDKSTPKLYPYRYLLTQFESSELKPNIKKRWQEYQLGFVLDKHWLLDDPTFQWGIYQNQLKPTSQLAKENGVWVNAENNRALLLINSEKDPQALTDIDEKLVSILGKDNFQLSGSDWVALQAEQQIKQAVNWITSLAVVMVFLALFVAFRSTQLIFYSSLPLVVAFLVGVLSTISFFGHMQMITLALGAILLGVAIDYPIHTISAYQSRKITVVLRLWPTIRLGALTSAFGFLMLWWTDIEGLQQIAIFASSGLLSALLVTYVLRPYLAEFYKFEEQKKLDDSINLKTTANDTIRSHPNVIFYLLPGLVIMAAIFYLKPIQWQDDIASLSPVSKELISTDKQLRALFNYQEVGKKLLLPAANIESLLQKEESLLAELNTLKKSGAITQFQMLSQILPSQVEQAHRQQNVPESKSLITDLSQAVEGTGFKSKHFQVFVNSVEQSKNLPLLTYDQFIDSAGTSAQLAKQLALPISNQMIGVINLSGVSSDQAIQDFVTQQSNFGLIYFNQRSLVAQQISEIRTRLFQILIFIIAVIVLSLWLKYRNIRPILTVLAPVLMAIGFTFATFALLNISLSIFHLMSLMLVAAIGIDYALLFFEGAVQKEDGNEWSRSVLVAFFTTVGSFSILSLSQLALLHAIGLTVLIGVFWVYSLSFFMSKRLAVKNDF